MGFEKIEQVLIAESSNGRAHIKEFHLKGMKPQLTSQISTFGVDLPRWDFFWEGGNYFLCVKRKTSFLKFSNCQVRSNFFGNIAVKTELEQKFHRLKIMLSVISLQTDGIFINCCIISIYPKIKGWVLIREAILGILWIKKVKKTQLFVLSSKQPCFRNVILILMLYLN